MYDVVIKFQYCISKYYYYYIVFKKKLLLFGLLCVTNIIINTDCQNQYDSSLGLRRLMFSNAIISELSAVSYARNYYKITKTNHRFIINYAMKYKYSTKIIK